MLAEVADILDWSSASAARHALRSVDAVESELIARGLDPTDENLRLVIFTAARRAQYSRYDERLPLLDFLISRILSFSEPSRSLVLDSTLRALKQGGSVVSALKLARIIAAQRKLLITDEDIRGIVSRPHVLAEQIILGAHWDRWRGR